MNHPSTRYARLRVRQGAVHAGPVESDQVDGVFLQKGRATNGDRRGLHALGV